MFIIHDDGNGDGFMDYTKIVQHDFSFFSNSTSNKHGWRNVWDWNKEIKLNWIIKKIVLYAHESRKMSHTVP